MSDADHWRDAVLLQVSRTQVDRFTLGQGVAPATLRLARTAAPPVPAVTPVQLATLETAHQQAAGCLPSLLHSPSPRLVSRLL